MSSYLKTTVLLAALTALFMTLGFAMGGRQGMMIALMVALATNLFAWWNSDSMVLNAYGAQEVNAHTAPEYYALVAELAQRAGLPMPRVYIMENEQPNAFATGRDPEHGAVAATTGLLSMMSREQVAGVIAHELAHIRNRDTLIMTITATMAGAISMLAQFSMFFGSSRDSEERGGGGFAGGLLMMILGPIAASLVQMAISRTREYEADRLGAEICGQPLWLASALDRLDHATHAIPNPAAEERPATAHLFIANPLSGGTIASLFSTHPPMAERIARLQAMGGGVGGRSRRDSSAPGKRRGPWG